MGKIHKNPWKSIKIENFRSEINFFQIRAQTFDGRGLETHLSEN